MHNTKELDKCINKMVRLIDSKELQEVTYKKYNNTEEYHFNKDKNTVSNNNIKFYANSKEIKCYIYKNITHSWDITLNIDNLEFKAFNELGVYQLHGLFKNIDVSYSLTSSKLMLIQLINDEVHSYLKVPFVTGSKGRINKRNIEARALVVGFCLNNIDANITEISAALGFDTNSTKRAIHNFDKKFESVKEVESINTIWKTILNKNKTIQYYIGD